MRLNEITLPNGDLTDEQVLQWVKDNNGYSDAPDFNSKNEIDIVATPNATYYVPPEFGTFALIDSAMALTKLPVTFGSVKVFNVARSSIESFEGFPHTVARYVDISKTKITSLVGISDVFKRLDTIYLNECAIRKGGIGLLLIPGLTYIHFTGMTGGRKQAFEIISKYLNQHEDGLFECQTELIEEGLEEFAEL